LRGEQRGLAFLEEHLEGDAAKGAALGRLELFAQRFTFSCGLQRICLLRLTPGGTWPGVELVASSCPRIRCSRGSSQVPIRRRASPRGATEAELAEAFERYGALVFRRCLALLGSQADADDALQTVFVRVHRYGFEAEPGKELAWLYVVATRCCIDLRKRRARDEPVEPSAFDAATDQTLERGLERRGQVILALDRLDQKTRDIGLAYHLEGWTQDELAARLGISRKTVQRKTADFELQLGSLLQQLQRFAEETR
jgi:RNA polymerase sigma-70 factor, ECF subfamily